MDSYVTTDILDRVIVRFGETLDVALQNNLKLIKELIGADDRLIAKAVKQLSDTTVDVHTGFAKFQKQLGQITGDIDQIKDNIQQIKDEIKQVKEFVGMDKSRH